MLAAFAAALSLLQTAMTSSTLRYVKAY